MTSKTYDGYSNYETWNVALWLGNDERTSRYWRGAAEEARREAATCGPVREGIWSEEEAPKYRLSERLKDEVEEGTPELEPSLYWDLLSAALSEVDWHEVAETFLRRTMDPKVEALVLALNDFARAALALERAWQEADDLTGDAMDGYPLPNAFEEATHDIVKWCRDAAATLSAEVES